MVFPMLTLSYQKLQCRYFMFMSLLISSIHYDFLLNSNEGYQNAQNTTIFKIIKKRSKNSTTYLLPSRASSDPWHDQVFYVFFFVLFFFFLKKKYIYIYINF
jgi:hypothetical protein